MAFAFICDFCGADMDANEDAFAICKDCGVIYGPERLKEKVFEAYYLMCRGRRPKDEILKRIAREAEENEKRTRLLQLQLVSVLARIADAAASAETEQERTASHFKNHNILPDRTAENGR